MANTNIYFLYQCKRILLVGLKVTVVQESCKFHPPTQTPVVSQYAGVFDSSRVGVFAPLLKELRCVLRLSSNLAFNVPRQLMKLKSLLSHFSSRWSGYFLRELRGLSYTDLRAPPPE